MVSGNISLFFFNPPCFNCLVHYLSFVLLVFVFLVAVVTTVAWSVLYHLSKLSSETVGKLYLAYGISNALTEALIITGLGFTVRSALSHNNIGALLGSRGL